MPYSTCTLVERGTHALEARDQQDKGEISKKRKDTTDQSRQNDSAVYFSEIQLSDVIILHTYSF